MTPNRVVAFLTPTVFAPAAGFASSWIAAHVPGTHISSSDLQAIFIAGALIALAPAAQWLHGWQKYEARESDAEHAVELANAAAMAAAPPAAAQAAAPLAAGLDDVDDTEGMSILAGLDDLDDTGDELLPDGAEPATTAG
jgi:hypothetical protein